VTSAAATFHRRIDKALADAGVRAALTGTMAKLANGRAGAMASLPDADAMRDEARAIRARTIAGLDRYLEQFAQNAEARGCRIHWAPTAADATRIVVEIAREAGITLAVKSKSMVTEEIELNAALEAAGVRVVETDLGEFVVQVGEDRPSHIIAPIVHRRREDVARLFQDKLGAKPEEVADVAAITAFARRTLRRDFLQAGMGISGVNMAVADSGSLCLVTNEGNGRLTTTLPRVHVAVMGLERVVPTAADLGVLLQLLARSATGQALSVYTNIVTGPRGPAGSGSPNAGEPDGPDQLHVVIVDNGRTTLLDGPLAEMLYCIRCGACLNVCPVYRHIGGHAYGGVYPGPMGAVVSPGLMGLDEWSELPHASSLCGACRDVCPVRIDLPHLLLTLRAQAADRMLAPWWLRLGMPIYAAVATRPALYQWLGSMAARVAHGMTRSGWLTRLPGPLAGWTASRDFPAPARRSFLQSYEERRSRAGRAS
jgi:L-lactate dehydrogenase complex protein LldF